MAEVTDWTCNRCGDWNIARDEECHNCEAPRDWEYDGPREVGDTTGDGPAVRAEQAERTRRNK